jgi:type IV pilus assembly protein PilM
VIFGKKKQLVGLDIGSTAVKLVELKQLDKEGMRYRLVNVGVEPVPPESIVDGAIMDSFAVADAVRRLFEKTGAKAAKAAVAVSGNGVIIKKMLLPQMSMEELNESIRWEAEQYIPFEIDEVNLDYEIVSGEERQDGQMEVILAAAKKDVISEYTGVVVQAGKEPGVVDVAAFALQNTTELNYSVADEVTTALINIGAATTNINIMSGNRSLFWRDLSIGGNYYTNAIQKELNLSFEDSELLKRGGSVEGVSFESVIPILNSVSEDMVGEFLKTFEFFKATSQYTNIDRILVSGGSALVYGLEQVITDKVGFKVEIFNAFKSIEVNENMFDAQFINEISSMAATAVGLAMRKEM